MQRTCKNLLALFLSVAILLSMVGVFNVSAETASPEFESIEELEKVVNDIFTANESEIVDLIKTQKPQSVEDKYVTLYQNCGPTSHAFQKVLLDNNIYAEYRNKHYVTQGGFSHAYNLMRVNFGGNMDKVYNIVLDCTYRQFMRSYFETALEEKLGTTPTANQIDEAMLNSKLPMVLVFEFGDFEGLDEKINSLLSESGYTDYFSASHNLNNYDILSYPDQVLQKFDSTLDFLTNSQKDKLRNIGLLNKPLDTELYVNNSADKKNAAKFEYKANGIYQCALSVENFGIENTEDFSFTIADENGNIVYGVAENTRTLDPFSTPDSSTMSMKEQVFLNSSLTGSLKANMTYCNMVLLRIDMRAGVDNPLISMFGVKTEYGEEGAYGARIYGDVDNDGAVTVSDATAIQLYLAKMDNLSEEDLTVANVTKSNELDIESATAIQMYLAQLDTDTKTGENVYFVNYIEIKYID